MNWGSGHYWNREARKLDGPIGPQNPSVIFSCDSGYSCWIIRLKPGTVLSDRSRQFAIAYFKVKYTVK